MKTCAFFWLQFRMNLIEMKIFLVLFYLYYPREK